MTPIQGFPACLAYIAGPFTADTDEARAANILRAQYVGMRVGLLGAAVIIPHTNTGLPPLYGGLSEEYLKRACFTSLARCDCIVLVEGWERSTGACAERNFALIVGLPIFEEETGYDGLVEFIAQCEGNEQDATG